MKHVWAILGWLVVMPILAGCSTTAEVVNKGSQANDQALNAAEFIICRGASIGSIRRKYGGPEGSVEWQQICAENDPFEMFPEGDDPEGAVVEPSST